MVNIIYKELIRDIEYSDDMKNIGDKQQTINIKKNFGEFWEFYSIQERKQIFVYINIWWEYEHLYTVGQLAFISMEKILKSIRNVGRGKLYIKTMYLIRWKGIPIDIVDN